MKRYLIVGLVIAVIMVGGTIFAHTPGSKSDTNVLGAVSAFSDLSPEQFNQAIKSGNYTLIDIRTIDEYNAEHLKNAKQSDFYQTKAFLDYLGSLNKNTTYLIYCRTGYRSGEALKIMRNKGFTSVYDMMGGYNAWIASGFPIEK
jgi:rhodanese-related sulfurtransferase